LDSDYFLFNEETLALDWIDQVGPGEGFLALDHTSSNSLEVRKSYR